MEKEIERRIGLIHAIAGIFFGIISGFIFKGKMPFLVVIIIGLIVGYPLMTFSRRVFNLSEKEFAFKDWLIKGFFIFFVIWLVVWTFVYNVMFALPR
jgi:hypothetical protein